MILPEGIRMLGGLGALVCSLMGCHEILEPTPADSWDYQQEQLGCVAEGTSLAAVIECRRASWAACNVRFGACPSPEPGR